MYLFILVVIVCSLLNVSKSSDEEKYIDLLPEEEKQAFLDKVARRLVNGVKTKDSRYKSSEEISDDELNSHSAYVRQVLEEESGSIRRNDDRTDRKETSKELKVKGIPKSSVVEDVEDANHIDLTLRGGYRRKRDGDDEYKTIPVETVYDNENEKSTSKYSAEKNADEKESKAHEQNDENSSAEDIQVRGPRKSRKVNESPNVEKNVISNEVTQAVDEAEYTTEANQNDSEENENPDVDDLKSNQKGYTVPIYDAEEDENESVTDTTPTIEAENSTADELTAPTSPETETTESASAKTTTVETTTAKNNETKVANSTQHKDNKKTHKKRYLRANDADADAESTTYSVKSVDNPSESTTNTEHSSTTSSVDEEVFNDEINDSSNDRVSSEDKSTFTANQFSVTTETFTTIASEDLNKDVEEKLSKVIENDQIESLSQTHQSLDISDDYNKYTTSLPQRTVFKEVVNSLRSNDNNTKQTNASDEETVTDNNDSEEKTSRSDFHNDTKLLTQVHKNVNMLNLEDDNSTKVSKETKVEKRDVTDKSKRKNETETVELNSEKAPNVPDYIESQNNSLKIARVADDHAINESDDKENIKVESDGKEEYVSSREPNKLEENLLKSNLNDSEVVEGYKVTEPSKKGTISSSVGNNSNESKPHDTNTEGSVRNIQSSKNIQEETDTNIVGSDKQETNVTKSNIRNTQSPENNKVTNITTDEPNTDNFKGNDTPSGNTKEFSTQRVTTTDFKIDSTTKTLKNQPYNNNPTNITKEEKAKEAVTENTLRTDESKQYVLTTTETHYVSTPKPEYATYKIFYSQYVSDNETVINGTKTINFVSDKQNFNDENADREADFVNQSVNLRNILEAIGETVKSPNNSKALRQGEIQSYLPDKRKGLEVYEIAPGENPFVKKEKVQQKGKDKKKEKVKNQSDNQDQPYYVPVYNYAPNNAYYNPYNRLGPNVDENQNDENVEILKEKPEDPREYSDIPSNSNEAEFKGFTGTVANYKSFRKFKFSGKKLMSNNMVNVANTKAQISLPLPLVVKKPKFTEIYFNPDEYLDLDYYFGRTTRNKGPNFRSRDGLNVPASFEELSPYNQISTHQAKNHLSAVRKLLFENGHFGQIEPDHYKMSAEINTPSDSHEHKKDQKRKKLRNKKGKHKYRAFNEPDETNKNLRNQLNSYTHPQDIAIDYYFGVDDNVSKKRENSETVNKNIRNGVEVKVNKTEDIIKDKLTMRRLKHIAYAASDYSGSYEEEKNEIFMEKNGTFWEKNADVIQKLLEMSDSTNVFVTLKKLHDLNATHSMRTKDDDEINIYLSVLEDMIEMDNKALHQFDWLGSTVDVLAALRKLHSLINSVSEYTSIHPADEQLLKYVLHLYNAAKMSLEDSSYGLREEKSKKRKSALPRNPRKPKEYLTTKGLINRIWLYIRGGEKEDNLEEVNDFGEFLDDLDNSLYDLHNAIKHIALVTKYKKQRWYENLKEIYMKNTQKKYLLEILVHVYTTRLLGLIEDSAINGLEDGYLKYIKNNNKIVDRTVDEFVFVLKLLNEFKKLNTQML